MFFTGTPFITYATEAKVVGGEPTSRWTKPTLATINPGGLVAGAVYTVDHTEVASYCTYVSLEEIPGRTYNSVIFEDVDKQSAEDDAKHPYHCRDNEE